MDVNDMKLMHMSNISSMSIEMKISLHPVWDIKKAVEQWQQTWWVISLVITPSIITLLFILV